MGTTTELLTLAAEVLNERGQGRVRNHLADNREDLAKVVILGAIDGMYEDGKLTDEAAAAHYKRLGMDREDASRLRQNAAKK